ncbi:unnamed protein product [Lupinus luteus]|uniref:Uncharacterized protein n=1 Tax=Lupinus luteus TaxID=3873 RepID=A0AAV1Y3V1_LUPLU
MLKLWKRYQKCLTFHPVKTQVISSGVIWGVGDIAAQLVTHSIPNKTLSHSKDGNEDFKINWKRVATTSLFGFGFVGPVGLDDKGHAYFKLEHHALNLLIAGSLLWVVGSIHNTCQIYERADGHVQILQQVIVWSLQNIYSRFGLCSILPDMVEMSFLLHESLFQLETKKHQLWIFIWFVVIWSLWINRNKVFSSIPSLMFNRLCSLFTLTHGTLSRLGALLFRPLFYNRFGNMLFVWALLFNCRG